MASSTKPDVEYTTYRFVAKEDRDRDAATVNVSKKIARFRHAVFMYNVACCRDALSCGCPARAPGSATVIPVVKQGVVSVGRAGEVRPSSRSAIDGACAEVFCCANIIIHEYESKQVYYETAERVTGSDEVVFL